MNRAKRTAWGRRTEKVSSQVVSGLSGDISRTDLWTRQIGSASAPMRNPDRPKRKRKPSVPVIDSHVSKAVVNDGVVKKKETNEKTIDDKLTLTGGDGDSSESKSLKPANKLRRKEDLSAHSVNHIKGNID